MRGERFWITSSLPTSTTAIQVNINESFIWKIFELYSLKPTIAKQNTILKNYIKYNDYTFCAHAINKVRKYITIKKFYRHLLYDIQ